MGAPRALRIFAVVVGVLAVVEGAAWVVDGQTGFRGRLLESLSSIESHDEPVATVSDGLPWADPLIAMRVYERSGGAEYVVAGKAVPGSITNTTGDVRRPEELRQAKYRVFIIGESAAYGFPYPYALSLGKRLGETLEKKGYDFVNASQPSWTSSQLVPLARRIIDRDQPYGLIVFMGGGEWFHWRPAILPRVPPAVLSIARLAAHSRAAAGVLYGLVGFLARYQDELRQGKQSGYVIHHELTGFQFALDHPYEESGEFDAAAWLGQKKRALDNFEANLTEIVTHARGRGVRVVLVTIPFRSKLSPAWKSPQPESFDKASRAEARDAVASAARLISQGNCKEALGVVSAALAKDPNPPILHYLRGTCLERLGRPTEAEAAYIQSRENMVGNLGGVLSINERIRRVAARTGTGLVDAAALFEQDERARGALLSDDLFADDCHPTPAGTKLIADGIARLLGE